MVLCGLVISYDLFILIVGLNNPLIDLHSFRQTQTAISAYWIMKGGPLIAYETPVLGSPWSIPFEFPLYQWIVALLGKIGVPLDAAGRVVSFVFFYACLWPLYSLYRKLNFGTYAYLVTATLFLASPIHIYWSRTFMIETCALFFGLLWLAWFIEFANQPRPKLFLGVLLAGTLGSLTKSTTFPAFALLGGFYFLYTFYIERIQDRNIDSLKRWAPLIALLVLPFIPAILWVIYSDSIKLANPIGPKLTSSALSEWNFGTLEHRLSLDLWINTIARRAVPDIFGYAASTAFGLILITMLSRRFGLFMFASVLAFFSPFLIFTNLHMVHNYYQMANALFLIAAVGLALAVIAGKGYKKIATFVAAAMVVGQLTFFHANYYPAVTRTSTGLLRFALAVKNLTPPDGSLIIINKDWSSLIPYYSQRKSLIISDWISNPLLERMIADPQDFLDNRRLAGIVVCDSKSVHKIVKKFQFILDKQEEVAREGNCRLYQ